MRTLDYQLVVVGAGPGGYQAAIRGAQLGLSTAIVEKEPALGGTCLRVGCIPSKALLESSERLEQARDGLADHGIDTGDVAFDLSRMLARKDKIVGALTGGVAGLMRKHKIDVHAGVARFTDGGSLAVGDDVELRAEHTVIATGSAPIELPHLPMDGNRVVSSTEALSFEHVPERLLVVGGGAIGLELGSVWSRLGADVVVVELTDQIVPGADHDAARALARALSKQGLDLRLETSAAGLSVAEDSVSVDLDGKKGRTSERFDRVLVAVGRRAYTDGLGLDAVAIETDERGRVVVDANFATSRPGVYAIGDVVAGPMLAHKAEEEGVACVERLADVAGHVNYAAIPSVVYTWPELASVGLGERAAQAEGLDVRVGKFPFQANARARCHGATEGLAKVVADATTDRLLGVHIVGPAASELIAEAAVAMEFSASAEDLARSVHAHPTLAEVIKEAALACGSGSRNI